MAVYYKFKSAKDYDSIPIEGQFISVVDLKGRIFESNHLGRGTDFDLVISNAQNDEKYVDEAAMIPKNTFVIIRRIPGHPRKPIVTQRDEPKVIENTLEEPLPWSGLFATSESEWDEFGNDLYATPNDVPAQSSIPPIDASNASMTDEENKIKALVETPALDWSCQGQDGFGGGRGFGRGMGGRMMSGRGFGPGYERPFQRKTPPPGYVCHRCKVPGHLIQHCPTNGDPSYEVRTMKPPTGIPKSMLMTTTDGSYSMPSGAVAVLKPNEDAFDKEIQGMPTTHQISDLPPELRCPLCKQVIKDAVLTSKCCFRSFCDKCIRDYIINNSTCQCGATDTLADDLIPNKTLRETINHMLESSTRSAAKAGSHVYVHGMEPACPMLPKISSLPLSAASKDGLKKSHSERSSGLKAECAKEDDIASKGKAIDGAEHSDMNALKRTSPLEAKPESISTEEPIPAGNKSVPDKVPEKVPDDDQGKKKKKKKTRVPGNAVYMQWPGFQNSGAENYSGMSMCPADHNTYWNGGMAMDFDGLMPPYDGSMPCMGYGPGPVNVPFDVLINTPDPYAAHGYMMQSFPQTKSLSEMGYSNMNKNIGSPMSREEFEAMKVYIRKKRERERLSEREHIKGSKGVANNSDIDVSSNKKRPRSISSSERTSDPDRCHHESSHRSRLPPSSSKRRLSGSEESQKAEDIPSEQLPHKPNLKPKGSVFSRISFPGSDVGTVTKKRKSSDENVATLNEVIVKEHDDQHHNHRDRHRSHSNGCRNSREPESSEDDENDDDDDYYFKRRPSRRHKREGRCEIF